MGKSKMKNKKDSPKQKKSVLNGVGGSISKPQMAENTTELLEKSTILLQTGQAEAALPLAQRVLELSPEKSAESLLAVNLIGEINVELGDIDAARQTFLHAVQIDPEGTIPESQGGGAEKFLWLAQLSEQGGADSVGWYEKGVGALRHIIQSLEQSTRPEDAALCEEKRKKLATALCGVVEIYMTDLS
jgi:tetratricopeptide (TPR) repeat protein